MKCNFFVSTHLHELIVTCAESRVAHLCRSTGRPELESQLGVITGQYRRLLSSCIVRAQAQCLISRIGVITPEARGDWTTGAAIAGGAASTVDGKPTGARLGKEGTLPWFLKLRNILCLHFRFYSHTIAFPVLNKCC